MMNGREIIRLVETSLIDDDMDTDSELLLINDALRDLSREAPYKDVVQLTVESGQRVINVDPNLRIHSVVTLRSGNLEIEFIDTSLIDDLSKTGTPTNFYYLGKRIALYPIPDQELVLDAVVKRGYKPLTSLNEHINDLPEEYHDAIAYYVAWKIVDIDDVEKFEMFRAEYERRLRELKVMFELDLGEGNNQYTKDVLPKSAGRKWR